MAHASGDDVKRRPVGLAPRSDLPRSATKAGAPLPAPSEAEAFGVKLGRRLSAAFESHPVPPELEQRVLGSVFAAARARAAERAEARAMATEVTSATAKVAERASAASPGAGRSVLSALSACSTSGRKLGTLARLPPSGKTSSSGPSVELGGGAVGELRAARGDTLRLALKNPDARPRWVVALDLARRQLVLPPRRLAARAATTLRWTLPKVAGERALVVACFARSPDVNPLLGARAAAWSEAGVLEWGACVVEVG